MSGLPHVPYQAILGGLGVLFAYALLRENYEEIRKGRAAKAELEERADSRLGILFEPVAPFVQVDLSPGHPSVRHVRVGVKNLGGQRVEHAALKLEEADPHNAFTPIELSERHDMGGPGGTGSQRTFAINADDTVYVDVAMKRDGAGEEIVLRYARPQHNMLAPGRYVITLRATAPAGEATSRRFVLFVNDEHQLTLEPVVPEAGD